MDISKYFRKSLGIRDNESRLYFKFHLLIFRVSSLRAIACVFDYSMLGRRFNRQHFETLFLFLPESSTWHFMQIGFQIDNLHEVSNPIFTEK